MSPRLSVPTSSPRVNLAASLTAQAHRTVAHLVKWRARAYADRRADLDVIAPGLSEAAPQTLIAVGKDLLALERLLPRRWFGFGGETPAINAKALIVLGRALRRRAAS
ncbi:hypothetical protein Msil_3039 [Methylocella silvestris BL2]|uniref:Uncharacterized protein n=1 Tax=Methylocella silvestris (strain DSM 15510 / CIP 108128 / LMG 27833 / NCIMB 13906 / BL2) TaxID=395965 RepID=B8EKS1_METSB|nr:hypothetical protein [Methylocella silvestris]ACK51949.1 hypothetical protein Msil_3039 [Methylocella silvestris BL2]